MIPEAQKLVACQLSIAREERIWSRANQHSEPADYAQPPHAALHSCEYIMMCFSLPPARQRTIKRLRASLH